MVASIPEPCALPAGFHSLMTVAMFQTEIPGRENLIFVQCGPGVHLNAVNKLRVGGDGGRGESNLSGLWAGQGGTDLEKLIDQGKSADS